MPTGKALPTFRKGHIALLGSNSSRRLITHVYSVTKNQCLLLESMQLTFTAWVNHSDRVKNMSLSHCMTLFPFVRCLVYNKPKSNLCIVLTTQNTTENNCIISHAQNTTALQPNVFLSRIHRLLCTSKGRSRFPSQTTAKVIYKLQSHYL
jgi:hypothetical protein